MWWVAAAWAQMVSSEAPALDVQRLRPSIDADGLLWVDDAGRRAEGQLSSRVVLGYADHLLVYRVGDDEVRLVDSLWSMDLLFGVQAGRVRGGARVPVVLLATSDVWPDAGGLGDLQLDGKITVVDGPEAPLDLAGSFRVTLPTHSLEQALGTPGGGMELALIASRSLGPLLFAANAGLSAMPTVVVGDVTVGPGAPVRAAAQWVADRGGAGLELAGTIPIAPSTAGPMPLEVLATGRWAVRTDLDLHFGIGRGIGAAIGSPGVRVLLGVGYRSPLQ